MDYIIEKGEKFSTITMKNEKLNSTIAPDLKEDFIRLSQEGEVNLILNLEEVKYCDSSGLSSLLTGNRQCRDNGGRLIICSLQDMVDKLIKISHLDSILKITPTFSEATDLMKMELLEDEINNS
jgi:anti-sigma B factor antagonist